MNASCSPESVSRRNFLTGTGSGLGALALTLLMQQESKGAAKLSGPQFHFAPRAKRVLWLFMHGGPSHMDLWDPKPDLIKYAGKPLP